MILIHEHSWKYINLAEKRQDWGYFHTGYCTTYIHIISFWGFIQFFGVKFQSNSPFSQLYFHIDNYSCFMQELKLKSFHCDNLPHTVCMPHYCIMCLKCNVSLFFPSWSQNTIYIHLCRNWLKHPECNVCLLALDSSIQYVSNRFGVV